MKTIAYNVEFKIGDDLIKLQGAATDNNELQDAIKVMVSAIINPKVNTRFNMRVRGIPENGRIPAIKAIRTVTGYGLREAKDLCDAAATSFQFVPTIINGKPEIYDREIAEKVLIQLKPFFTDVEAKPL